MSISTQELKFTPLLQEHKNLGARLAPFGRWLMPIQYNGIIAEHNWTRHSCSLFDICHMGEFIVYGDADESRLNEIVTFNLDKMPVGVCRYGFMLNEKGGIIDDMIVYKTRQDRYMLVVNATTTDKDESHLKRHLSKNAMLENISASTGKVDLQGPLSKQVLIDIIIPNVLPLRYYTFKSSKLLGGDVIISRTGYTGELGYELYIRNEKISELWQMLLSDKRVRPAGLGARDTLRLEMGYLLYGQDMDEDISPLEAGLEDFVDYDKDFIGREAILKIKKQGISRRLIYFATKSRRSPRHDNKIFYGSKEIGIVTSGSFAPSLKFTIGMGYVEMGLGKIGSKVLIRQEHTEIEAVVTERPFYKKGTAKISV